MSGVISNEGVNLVLESAHATDNVRIILGSGFQLDYVREIANAYAAIGRDVEVVGGDMHASAAFHPGVRFLNLRGRDTREESGLAELRKLARYYWRLLRHVASSKAGAVYDVSIGRPFLRCLLMYTAFRFLGKRVIYTAHNVLPHDKATLLNKVIYFFIYRGLVDEIVVHGESLKKRLIDEFGVPACRVHVISHGTYNPQVDDDITRVSARTAMGIAQDAYVGLIFGFQRPYKGTEFALKAMAFSQLPREMTVLIRGDAPDLAYRTQLEDLISDLSGRLSINARIESVSERDVEALFKAADVVLLPYLEGSQSGIKYMAYAYGRPILVSDVGSLAEFVETGVNGELFASQDEHAFIAALSGMMNSPERYDEQRIKDIAYNDYSFEAAVRRVDSLYANLTIPRLNKVVPEGNKP